MIRQVNTADFRLHRIAHALDDNIKHALQVLRPVDFLNNTAKNTEHAIPSFRKALG